MRSNTNGQAVTRAVQNIQAVGGSGAAPRGTGIFSYQEEFCKRDDPFSHQITRR